MDTCVLCASVIGENEEARVIPKAKVHYWCLDNDPRTPDEIADLLTCCSSRAVLKGMGGHLIEKRPTIPRDQMWFVMKGDTGPQIHRYRVFEHGDVVLATLPPLVVPPKKTEDPDGQEQ